MLHRGRPTQTSTDIFFGQIRCWIKLFVCVRVGPWLLIFFLRLIVNNSRGLQARVLQHSQRRFDNCLLVYGIIGYTQRVPVPERDDQRARGPHFLGHFAQQLNRHRGDTLALQFRRHQAHGLVAYRSDGHQQGDVDTIFNQFAHRHRCGFFYQAPGGCNGSHEGQMPLV